MYTEQDFQGCVWIIFGFIALFLVVLVASFVGWSTLLAYWPHGIVFVLGVLSGWWFNR